MGNPQWRDNQSPTLEFKDIDVDASTSWEQKQHITVNSFGVVSVRATLKLNSEAIVSRTLVFEVKEPFHVENRVLSPPATYLFLPVFTPSTSDPLSIAQGGRVSATSNSISIAEERDAFVQLAVKCRADCALILMDAAYVAAKDCPLEVRSCPELLSMTLF